MGYTTVSSLRAAGVPTSVTDPTLEVMIELASQMIDEWTGWWFEPREMTLKADGAGTPALLLSVPICRVDEVRIRTDDFDPVFDVLESDTYLVYNRHLSGLTQPDDRQNPKLEIRRNDDGRPSLSSLGRFPLGRQNVEIDGAFGYTDRDPSETTPEGITPKLIAYACDLVVIRVLKPGTPMYDTGAWDEAAASRRGVQSLRTRDQSISFFGGASGAGSVSFPTGDPEIDRILVRYVRPPAIGCV